MKPLKFILLSVFMLLCLPDIHAHNSVFEKYNEMKNVSSVYISKTMLEMQPNLYTKDVYIGKVAGQLDAVYILSTMHNDIRKNMKKDIDDFVKKGKYELLMKQQGLVSGSSFYVKKKGEKIQELIMITDGAAKLNFVHLIGDLTIKDIQRITNRAEYTSDVLLPFSGKEIEKVKKDIRVAIDNIDLSALRQGLKEMELAFKDFPF
ncbi:MAG: DUF4252 domain-containing protein [Bacteroides sp.]|nr:DUF4252 domain-containing protein [Bacteroides sp.]